MNDKAGERVRTKNKPNQIIFIRRKDDWVDSLTEKKGYCLHGCTQLANKTLQIIIYMHTYKWISFHVLSWYIIYSLIRSLALLLSKQYITVGLKNKTPVFSCCIIANYFLNILIFHSNFVQWNGHAGKTLYGALEKCLFVASERK